MLGDQVATDTQVITRRGTERVVRAAFELARRRGRVKPHVTCVDKANILRSFAFFRKVFDDVAATFPDVAADYLYVDAAAMELVRRPGRFDVLVTENLLGDILSDLAAALVGGLGVAPSADLGDRHAVFQPCHGTAPDIAGHGVANPIAAILSGVMLLDYLADRHADSAPCEAVRRIEAAVAAAVGSGTAMTADVGGRGTTRETLPTAALTAWRALVVAGGIKAGDSVLVLGTGGVSMFALQFAKMMGASVIATSSSDEKLQRARALGADHLINYQQVPEWGRAVRQATDGRGVDHVVEVGGPGTLPQSIVAGCIGGHIALIGVLTGIAGQVPTALLMGRQQRLHGITVGSRRHQQDMVRALEALALKPVIDRTFPLAELAAAFRYEESGQHFGKIAVTVD